MSKTILGIAIIVPLVGLIAPAAIAPNPAPAVADRTIAAVTLNMAKEADVARVFHSLDRAPRLREADVYLLQEVRHVDGKPSVADELAHRLGYSVAFTAAPGCIDQGLAIVSRYPVVDVAVSNLKACDLRFRSRKRFSMASTVRTPWGDVRVWNVHLDTRINAQERLSQLQPVMDDASCYSGPKMIGGDFNTNELFWLGNVVPLPFGPVHHLMIRETMRQRGFGTPFPQSVKTFRRFGSHLDWIFLSEMEPLDASIEPASFSDHHAVWVRAKL